ncbi:DUF4435 domain-containing protein [Xanthomonas hortorum]|uniref:DUF4435 domain-containing protein n=1 Tax=Xanthomonas hortorum TaxID=56454 RepID=UPI0029361E96|nr:DUF4435 domain-containing protein [Xanthomonas hortorum]MDV2450644.1 hypothetical protein [Xanthomonas hortorum NBC5720]
MSESVRPTVDEIYHLLKRTSIPTVLVEGKCDVILYRRIEEDLKQYGVDILPAGNKGAVLALRERILNDPVSCQVLFIVDKDLWVHCSPGHGHDELITTEGYSIENDLFRDGELENLLSADEGKVFRAELAVFVEWYALSVNRSLAGIEDGFRTHPNKILDNRDETVMNMQLHVGEHYPHKLKDEIIADYRRVLRGKSLFALLVRRLSGRKRNTKFGVNQLMEIGASRRGENYHRICSAVRARLEGGG